MKKILVVDDQEELLELTKRLLQTRGYSVITLPEGANVLPTAREQHPDLIIMDMLLPDKDGTVICDELKSDPSLASIPVILASGQLEDDSEAFHGELKKPDDRLVKPFEIEELLEKIKKFLPDA